MVSRAFNLWKNLILSCIWMDYPLKPSKSSVIGDILVDGHQKLTIGAWIKCSICAELIDKHVHLTDWNHIHGNNEPALSKLRCHWEHSIEKVIPHDGLDHIVIQSWSMSPENESVCIDSYLKILHQPDYTIWERTNTMQTENRISISISIRSISSISSSVKKHMPCIVSIISKCSVDMP